MLVSPSDYTWLASYISGVDIQGRIIPTEDINEQPHPLRRENLAYLSEMVSERMELTFARVPAANAPLLKTLPSQLGTAIAGLYSGNTRFVNPSAQFERVVSQSASQTAADAYAANLYAAADCSIPSIPSALSADYLRRCFYFANRLDWRWYDHSPTVASYGGTVSASAKNKHGTGTGSTNCAASVLALGNISGTGSRVSINMPTGSTPPTSSQQFYLTGNTLYALDDLSSALFDAGEPCSEIYYAGWLYLGLSSRPTYISPRLFLRWKVVEGYATTSTTHYVWDPVNARTAENADGFAFEYAFAPSQSYLRGIVSSAVPGANFNLTGSQWRSYTVDYAGMAVLADSNFPSKLPSGWTWTP